MKYGTPIYANMIRVVKVIKDPDDSTFDLGLVYKCLPCDVIVDSKVQGGSFSIVPYSTDRAIYCASLNNSLLIENRYYIAYQVSPGNYVIDNQATFLDLV